MTDAAPLDPSSSGGADEVSSGLLGAGIAVTAWSTGTILAKYLDMDALAIGTYRFGVFFLGLAVWMQVRSGRWTWAHLWTIIRRSTWGGIALGADIILFFSAVKETSVVNATIIGSLQPILVGVVAARFFGEKIRPRDALWSLVALVGAFVVVRSAADQAVTSTRGDLLALGAMFSWSAYFIASKESRTRMSSTEFTAGTSIWTAAICILVGVPIGQDLSFPNASNWAWLAVMIIGSGIVGHALMNWSLQRIPLWVGSTFTLFIPVASALLAWAFLGEAVTLVQAIAMACVIGALMMIVRGQTKPAATGTAAATTTVAGATNA